MWIRALSLFLVIQVLSFGVWHSFYKDVQANEAEWELHESTDEPLESLRVVSSVDFSARSLESDLESLYENQRVELENILNWLPAEHRGSIKQVTLNYNQNAARGLGGQGKIILGSQEMDVEELVSVFIHEVGHNVAWSLKSQEMGESSPFYDGKIALHENDPIVAFFGISWEESDTQKSGAHPLDFVSGYARTNAHEDFAESYHFYMTSGETFKSLADFNQTLKAKYDFLRDQVFDGREFETGLAAENTNFRPWDVTKLGYDVKNIFGQLNQNNQL